ncbi:inositol monophosphatase 1 [Nymphalis io]|uniref:inositol monophosphatase 1 n=1 Tax=Inachis io TaxID=171585 RepID=UPI0021681E54|nr:inositol monophosphatase 1 [Nymphalis io]
MPNCHKCNYYNQIFAVKEVLKNSVNCCIHYNKRIYKRSYVKFFYIKPLRLSYIYLFTMTDAIDEYFEVALELVKSAGNLITDYTSGCKDFKIKSSDIDLVTEIDKKVEETLISGLSQKFPGHKFIGEESAFEGGKCVLTDEPTWIIDPVDGTLNFIHGYPSSCISLGLVINKEAVAGIIYNPIVNQLFTAKKGQGAYLNGRQIHVSQVKEVRNALISFEAGTARDEEKQRIVFENFKLIVTKAQGARTVGSAALNMAMVALGGSDAYFEFGIHAWDIAAGDIIVREAGGVCIDPAGGPFDILSRRVLCASSQELAQELATMLHQYYPERD